MIDLKTNYLGLELKNPIVIGASNLVMDLNVVKQLEEAGAAAIVYKSLFEEQIQLEAFEQDEAMEEYNERHAEMIRLFPNIEHAGPKEHLVNIMKIKDQVKIPVIASLNAVYDVSWVDYAKQLEETGVDALELNFYSLPKDFETEGKSIVKEQIDILQKVIKEVKIPVSVKLSPFYTNMLKVIAEMDKTGVKGFVLFNKLFQPDINIEEEKLHFPYNLSSEEDNRLPLRFAALLHGNIKAHVCANRGIFSGKHVVKMLLAGADCVQVVSTIYKNKPQHVKTMLKEIEDWMNKKGYKSLNDFKGKLAKKNVTDPFAYRRAQYVDILMKSEGIFEKYPLR